MKDQVAMAVADNLVVTKNQPKIFGSFILSDVDKSYWIGDLPHLYLGSIRYLGFRGDVTENKDPFLFESFPAPLRRLVCTPNSLSSLI